MSIGHSSACGRVWYMSMLQQSRSFCKSMPGQDILSIRAGIYEGLPHGFLSSAGLTFLIRQLPLLSRES